MQKIKGRPTRSAVRQNIVNILAVLGEGYAYNIAKTYMDLFPKVSTRLIYYHLKKGTDLKEFVAKGTKTEEGNYSWGSNADKNYFGLGPAAMPLKNPAIQEYFEKRQRAK
ncbi:hypothetical protein HY772_01140 [Candidatus Woesearchaeota archaeon]|nr:hypothetical protein [Candidatus Woesearchaeota archaeon]